MRVEREYTGLGTEYLPGDDSIALEQADSGSLMMAADICDAMLADDRISGSLKTRAFGVTSLNRSDSLEFEGSDEIKAAISSDWWDAVSEFELGRLIIWSSLLGVVPVQRVPVYGDRTNFVLQVWSPRWLSIIGGDWHIETTDGVIPLDGREFALYQLSATRPWAYGAWRPIFDWWLMKHFGMHDWARYSELFGSGAIIGELPEGVSSKDQDAIRFKHDIMSLGRNLRFVVPFGYQLKLAAANNVVGSYPFKDEISEANTAISIAILGQPLTTEVPNAIQTGATAASLVREDYRKADCEMISSFSRRFLSEWALVNFGDDGLAPYVRYDAVLSRESKRSQRVSQLKTLGEALEKLILIPGVDVHALLTEFGVPMRVL